MQGRDARYILGLQGAQEAGCGETVRRLAQSGEAIKLSLCMLSVGGRLWKLHGISTGSLECYGKGDRGVNQVTGGSQIKAEEASLLNYRLIT